MDIAIYAIMPVLLVFTIPMLAVSIVFSFKIRSRLKMIPLIACAIVGGLMVGALVTGILASISYACAWVSFGLSLGMFVLGIVTILGTFFIKRKVNLEIRNQKQNSEPEIRYVKPSRNYIEEIKQLKGLLDDGAITEEEFSDLKKKILNGR